MTLRAKTISFFLLVAAIPALIIDGVAYTSERELTTKQQLNQLESVAAQAETTIKEIRADSTERLSLLTSHTQLRISLAKFYQDSVPKHLENIEILLAKRLPNDQIEIITPSRFSYTSRKLAAETKLSKQSLPSLAVRGINDTHTSAIDYRGKRVWAVTRQISDSGWGLVVKIDEDKALEPIYRLQEKLALATCLAMTLSVLLALFFSSHLSKRIRNLASVAKRINEGNLAEQAVDEGSDEISLLGSEFNHMTDSLLNSNRLLEARVRERTRELSKSTAFQQAILNSAQRSIIATNTEGTILLFSQGAEELLGYRAEEVVHQVTPEIIHDVDEVVARAHELSKELGRSIEPGFEVFVAKARDGQVEESEWTYVRKDGTHVPVLLSVTALTAKNGEIYGFLGIAQDISEQKRYENQLEQSEEHSRAMAERMKALYEIASHSDKSFDWQINETLKEACRLLGLDIAIISEIRGDNYKVKYTYAPETELAPGQEFELGKTYCALTLADDEPVAISHMGESEFRGHPCYSVFGLETYIGARFIVNDKPIGTVNFSKATPYGRAFNDSDKDFIKVVSRWLAALFERREAQHAVEEANSELERSNRELDQFAYVASHDLKSPLRAINTLAEWVLIDAADVLPEEAKENLETLKSRVMRMGKLLDDLLQYSRVGRIQEATEMLETNLVLDDVVKVLDIPEGFQVKHDKTMPVIVCPRAPVEKIFRNLINNAIKHHDKQHGIIEVHANENGEVVEFTVIDDGPGIPEQFHTQVFEMFKTLRSRDEVEGSGMGLAMVKKTVEALGGKISVESETGRGARFRFSLPKASVTRADDLIGIR